MSIPICITGEQVSGVIRLITMYCCHICYSIHEVRNVDNITNDMGKLDHEKGASS